MWLPTACQPEVVVATPAFDQVQGGACHNHGMSACVVRSAVLCSAGLESGTIMSRVHVYLAAVYEAQLLQDGHCTALQVESVHVQAWGASIHHLPEHKRGSQRCMCTSHMTRLHTRKRCVG